MTSSRKRYTAFLKFGKVFTPTGTKRTLAGRSTDLPLMSSSWTSSSGVHPKSVALRPPAGAGNAHAKHRHHHCRKNHILTPDLHPGFLLRAGVAANDSHSPPMENCPRAKADNTCQLESVYSLKTEALPFADGPCNCTRSKAQELWLRASLLEFSKRAPLKLRALSPTSEQEMLQNTR